MSFGPTSSSSSSWSRLQLAESLLPRGGLGAATASDEDDADGPPASGASGAAPHATAARDSALGTSYSSGGAGLGLARSASRIPHSLSSSPHSYEALSAVARAAAAAAATAAAAPQAHSPSRPESPLYGAASDLSLQVAHHGSKHAAAASSHPHPSSIDLSTGPPFRSLHHLSVIPVPSSPGGGGGGGDSSYPGSGASTPGSVRSAMSPFSLNAGAMGVAGASAGASHGATQDWTLFSLGLRLGALILLAFWVLWDCIVDSKLRPSQSDFWIDAVLPVYRCTGFLILGYWLWGMNVYVWTRYKINYLFLLNLNPRTSHTAREVFSAATKVSLVFLANFLVYFKIERGDFPRFLRLPDGLLPAGMFVLVLAIMAPWPGRCGTPLKQWPVAFAQVLIAPLGPVQFIHVFVGDVLTSMVKPLIDVAYSFCFLFSGLFLHRHLAPDGDASGGSGNGRVCLDSFVLNKVLTPIISALPLYLRLMQCFRRYFDTQQRFPHFVNAGKYATAMSVVLIGVFHQSFTRGSHGEHAAWIAALATSTMYSYSWDVLMDWDLGKRRQGPGRRGLRGDLIYGARWKYYSAIVLDLFFRFAWALTFVPAGAQSPLGKWWTKGLNPLVAGMEMGRRAVWALFRVENEHLVQIVNARQRQREEEEEQEQEELANQGAGAAFGSARKHSQDEFDYDPVAMTDQHSLRNQARAHAEANRRAFTTGLKLLLEIVALASVVTGAALISYFTA